MSRSREWITVPGWARFQHYGMARRPTWIKNYLDLLHKDEYLDLTLAARGLLHGIWLAYADRQGRLRRSELHAIGGRSTRSKHLTSLSDAGLIEFSASKPLLLTLEGPGTREEHRDEHARARERRANHARMWIGHGLAAEIPRERLSEVIADEFKIDEPTLLAELVAQAQEWTE